MLKKKNKVFTTRYCVSSDWIELILNHICYKVTLTTNNWDFQ